MSGLQDRRQARVAAALVAADDRFNAWQRANRELADEFRAARIIAAETRTGRSLPRSRVGDRTPCSSETLGTRETARGSLFADLARPTQR